MRRAAPPALGLALLAAACARAPAGDVLSGRLDATALGEVPGDAAVAVAAPQTTAHGARLRAVLLKVLAARHRRVEPGAPLILSYHAGASPAATSRGPLPDVGVAGVVGSSGTTDVGVSIGLPLLGLGASGRERYRYSVDLTLARRDGEVLWTGRVVGAAATRDIGLIARRTFPALLDHLGETVRGVDVIARRG